MHRTLATLIVITTVLAGCGDQQPAAPAASTPPAPASQGKLANVPPMRNFAPVKIGPYDVQPMFEEEIVDGHFNIRTSGGDVKAVRIWVGPEDATGVMVVKTEIENDYNHGHVEVPNPVPADAKLWIEIETTAGETHKGSTLLKQAV
ncbi:MAG: hypothetical protein SGI88_15495 [Candidatus Hydrogenedentes bacterium]|nr:hypothetical protein [Candidatus Hydrogenedentota bacterium]